MNVRRVAIQYHRDPIHQGLELGSVKAHNLCFESSNIVHRCDRDIVVLVLVFFTEAGILLVVGTTCFRVPEDHMELHLDLGDALPAYVVQFRFG